MSKRTDALAAFRTFLASATGHGVIFAEGELAGAPRPTPPYLTIEQTADVALTATPHEEYPYTAAVGTPGAPGYVADYLTTQRWQRRRATVQVVAYGDDAFDHLVGLRFDTRRVVDKTSPASTLRSAGVAAHPAADVLDTTAMRSTIWEPAASQEWHVYYVDYASNTVGIIETIATPISEA
jgi:hypothetical protein